MLSTYILFEKNIETGIVEKPNYTVHEYKPPRKNQIQIDTSTNKPMYRRKKIYDKDGKEHILTFAIMKKSGNRGGHTYLTSKWDRK